MHSVKIPLAALAATALLFTAGCGSSGSSGGAADAGTTGQEAAGGDGPTSTPAGTVKLVIDGRAVDTGAPGDCNINDLETEPVFAFSSTQDGTSEGLNVRLPGTPGTLGQRDGNVILPAPSSSDSYQPTLQVTGSWSRSGDVASGHLEGTAKLMSSLGAAPEPAPSTFTVDFTCKVNEIHLDDLPG